jgi:hypothetical protein
MSMPKTRHHEVAEDREERETDVVQPFPVHVARCEAPVEDPHQRRQCRDGEQKAGSAPIPSVIRLGAPSAFTKVAAKTNSERPEEAAATLSHGRDVVPGLPATVMGPARPEPARLTVGSASETTSGSERVGLLAFPPLVPWSNRPGQSC